MHLYLEMDDGTLFDGEVGPGGFSSLEALEAAATAARPGARVVVDSTAPLTSFVPVGHPIVSGGTLTPMPVISANQAAALQDALAQGEYSADAAANAAQILVDNGFAVPAGAQGSVVNGSGGLSYVPVATPPPTPAAASSAGSSPAATAAASNPISAGPIPVPLSPLPPVRFGNGQYPPAVSLSKTPPAVSGPDVTQLLTVTPVPVIVGGRQRLASSVVDLVNTIAGGNGVVIPRQDGTAGLIQQVMAPGWSSPGWLVDGNPANVLLGMGWTPGQREFVQGMVALSQIPSPTLTAEPDWIPSSPATPMPAAAAGGASISLSAPDPLVLAGIGLVLVLLFRRRSA